MRKITKSDCSGCENNFYNGNNPYGVAECWSFKTAKLCKKLDIPIDLVPPYKHIKPTTRPDCYEAKRVARVSPDRIRTDGYWKF